MIIPFSNEILKKELLDNYLLLSSIPSNKNEYYKHDLCYGANSKFKPITKSMLCSFFSIYLRIVYSKYHSCYTMNFNLQEINEINNLIKLCIANGQTYNISEVILSFIIKYESFLYLHVNILNHPSSPPKVSLFSKLIAFFR